MKDGFKSYLALNPLQNFFATLKFRKPQFDEGTVKQHFSTMANLMGLDDEEFSYKRNCSSVCRLVNFQA
jgi:hypothetical protein